MASEAYGRRGISDISPSSVCDTARANPGEVLRWRGDDYMYVYNDGNSQISPGFGCTVTAVSGYSVTISSASGLDPCVGIVKHSTITTGAYGWLLTKGYVNVEAAANSALAAGDAIWITANGTHGKVTAGTGYHFPPHGKSLAVIPSAGSGQALVNCFF